MADTFTAFAASAPFPHSVRARLHDGWREQPCFDEAQAIAVFDALMAYDGVDIERLRHGRAVELRRAMPVPGLAGRAA